MLWRASTLKEKVMQVNEYNKNAERTLSNNFHTCPHTEIMLHGAIGIVTELGEILQALNGRLIDVVNIKEEIGDVLWYLSIFDRHYNLELRGDVNTDSMGYMNIESLACDAFCTAGEILDLYKKKLYYDRPIEDNDVKSLVRYLFKTMAVMAEFCGTSLDSIRQVNIEKLRKRFPGKFTSENANVRDLKAERQILEQENGNNNFGETQAP